MVKNLPANAEHLGETQLLSLGQEDSLEKKMSVHSSIFAGKIPCTEKPERLQSVK